MKSSHTLGFLSNYGRLACLALTMQLAATGLMAADTYPSLTGQSDYQAAALDAKELELAIEFPGAATARSIAEGTAVVSVAINAQGQATDFLVTSCTDEVFGRALLDWVKVLKYQPAKFRGQAVAGRCDISYHFLYRTAGGEHSFGFSAWGTSSGGMQVGSAMTEDVFGHFSGKSLQKKPAVEAVAEKTLTAPLEITEAALPKLPVGYAAPADKPVKVFVTFYIDAEGKVRLPNVESAASPELIAGAIKAVGMWSFKPATVNGKPALVYTGRAVGFLPRNLTASLQ